MYKFLRFLLLFGLITLGLYLTQKSQPTTTSAKQQTNFANELASQITQTTSPKKAKDDEQTSATTNIEASFQLAKQMRDCRNVASSEQELAEWLDKALLNQEPQAYIDDVLARYDQCSSLFLPNTNYINLLINAAEADHHQAIAMLWSVSENEYFTLMKLQGLTRAEHIAHRKLFLKTQYKFAQIAAQQGCGQSLLNLIKGYQHHDPELNAPNVTKALSYAYYALDVIEDNDIYRKVDWIKQQLENKLTSKQLSDARKQHYLLQQNQLN